MYYVINDYYNLINSKYSIIMFNIVPNSYSQKEFYVNLINNNIEGIIVFVNNKSNLKLLMLLNELDIPIIVVSNYDLENIGLKVIKPNNLIELTFNKSDQKVTRPFKIAIVEEYIKLIEKELNVHKNLERFVSIQILYENTYFDNLLNDKINSLKKELEEKLGKSSRKIIDETIDYFIEHSFNIN